MYLHLSSISHAYCRVYAVHCKIKPLYALHYLYDLMNNCNQLYIYKKSLNTALKHNKPSWRKKS